MILKVDSLTFEYPGIKALDNIDLEIDKGRITALVGPNGAGKTTLLKCVAGLIKPIKGSIYIDGLDIFKEPHSAKKKIGFLQDFFGLYDDLTLVQYLDFFYSAYFMPEGNKEEKIETILNKVNLIGKKEEKVGSLSRGMRQRLAIGRTLLHEPELLLLDEPASGLDPEARNELALLFKELNKDGVNLIVSSHILSELDEYADSMVAIRDGKIIKSEEIDGEKKVKLLIELIEANDDATLILSQNEFVSNLRHSDVHISFDFSGDHEQRFELLKELINNDIKIISFTGKDRDLQEEYLEMVRNSKIKEEVK